MSVDLLVPELRDYRRINDELTRLLNDGETLIRLKGVEGQRLLLHGLSGPWNAIVEVQGWAGPEVAAELAAPCLAVICLGDAAEGAGRGLSSGHLLITGAAGEAVGYGQRGGRIVVNGPVGSRAGLNQVGGTLMLLGPVGSLAGERQLGGHVLARSDRLGPHSGRGRRGGEFSRILPSEGFDDVSSDEDVVRGFLDADFRSEPRLPEGWRRVDG